MNNTRDLFRLYLEKTRMDISLIPILIEFAESDLPNYIRRFFSQDYTSLYEETNPLFYEEARRGIFVNPMAEAENRAADNAYSQAMKYYAGFLRSKFFSTATFVTKPIPVQATPPTIAQKHHLKEGAKVQVRMEKHERNPELRKACIDHYGYVCQVCGLDFTKAYGELGKDFIEVHHLTPISTTDGEHEVDPINDLVPLCSNCHSMIHRGEDGPLTLEELRAEYKGVKWNEWTD